MDHDSIPRGGDHPKRPTLYSTLRIILPVAGCSMDTELLYLMGPVSVVGCRVYPLSFFWVSTGHQGLDLICQTKNNEFSGYHCY